jgi:transposase
MPKSKPPYPAEFRQQIIELARAGRTPAQFSREFGPTAQSIANWIAQDGRDRGKPLPSKEGLTTVEREELVRLRRRLRQVEQERDILAKATAWFAGKRRRRPHRLRTREREPGRRQQGP